MNHPGIPLDNQKLKERHEEITQIAVQEKISYQAAVDKLRERFRKRYNGQLFDCIAKELEALEEVYKKNAKPKRQHRSA